MADGIVINQPKAGWITARYHVGGNVSLGNSAGVAWNFLENANNHSDETVTAMNIMEAEWSIGNGAFWTVTRGANTVLVLTEGQHAFDFSDGRLIDNAGGEPQANVVVTKTGSGGSTLILKIHKKSTIAGGSQY